MYIIRRCIGHQMHTSWTPEIHGVGDDDLTFRAPEGLIPFRNVYLIESLVADRAELNDRDHGCLSPVVLCRSPSISTTRTQLRAPAETRYPVAVVRLSSRLPFRFISFSRVAISLSRRSSTRLFSASVAARAASALPCAYPSSNPAMRILSSRFSFCSNVSGAWGCGRDLIVAANVFLLCIR